MICNRSRRASILRTRFILLVRGTLRVPLLVKESLMLSAWQLRHTECAYYFSRGFWHAIDSDYQSKRGSRQDYHGGQLEAAAGRSRPARGLIDMDPQAHASLHLGLGHDLEQRTVYDLLTSDVALSDVWQKAGPALSVAPSHIDLAAAEVELAGVVGRELILRDKLANTCQDFDYVLIDCPPSLGILTINALSAVDDVFLPLQPHFLALHGLSKLLQTINLVAQRLNDRLRLAGVLFCLFDTGTRLAAEVSSDVEAFFQDARNKPGIWQEVHLFETRIRRNIRLAEAPSFGQSIFQYLPQSAGAEDYLALAEEMLFQADGEQTSHSVLRPAA